MDSQMQDHKILFSAPHAFMPFIMERRYPFMVEFHEVWHQHELRPDPQITGWITNTGWSFILGDAVLDLFPSLRVVVTPSTGKDHIDEAALKRRGISFYSLLDDRTGLEAIASSAEFTFLLLLNTLRRLPYATQAVRERIWRRDRENELRGHELQGRKVGLVGLGRIGRRMRRYCEAFGASIIYYDPYVECGEVERAESLETLFASADSIVICCTLTDETHGMIGREALDQMRYGGTLVNTARGAVLDEYALAKFLQVRPDVTIALDVLDGEAKGAQYESPLIELVDQNRIALTPHIAGSSYESQTKAAEIAFGLISKHINEHK
jgi:D-3-phosphoglycerate dehydrogenase